MGKYPCSFLLISVVVVYMIYVDMFPDTTFSRLFWIVCSFNIIVEPTVDIKSLTSEYINHEASFYSTHIQQRNQSKPSDSNDTHPNCSARLQTNLLPRHYDITLKSHVNLLKPHLEGEVQIIISCRAATPIIVLNAMNIKIHNLTLFRWSSSGVGDMIEVERVDELKEVEQMAVVLRKDIPEGTEVVLRIWFMADIVGPLEGRGMYWEPYMDGNKTKILAVTQFSPAGARRTFPCFDEPSFKATFNLTVWRKPHMTALSNMPVYSTNRVDGWAVDHFERTPHMSTYLLAVAITEYNYTQTTRPDGTKIRIWAKTSDLPRTHYALNLVDPFLTYFEKYTGIPYGLPKLDLLVSASHPVRAMENWGLLIYQTEALLWQPDDSLAVHQLEVTLTLAHEISHFWFGNLVTPAWWDEVWLKEGFATFFMFEPISSIFPNWPINELFLSRTMFPVMSSDMETDSQPVVFKVDELGQLPFVFSNQAYSKAGCMVKFLQSYLGKETFDKAMRYFIQWNVYETVTSDDLWQAFSAVMAEDNIYRSVSASTLFEYIDTWLKQPGYPYLEISLSGTFNVVNLKQGALTLDKKKTDQLDRTGIYHVLYNVIEADDLQQKGNPLVERHTGVWPIPFDAYIFDEEGNQRSSMFKWITYQRDKGQLYTNLQRYNEFSYKPVIITNPDQFGYFGSYYSDIEWRDITNILYKNHTTIPMTARAQLIDDAFRLARCGFISDLVAFELIQYMREEVDCLPWEVALRNLGFVISVITHTDMDSYLKRIGTVLISNIYHDLGWESRPDESITRRMARREILSRACQFNYEPCLSHTLQVFNMWMGNTTLRLDTDLKSVILCYGVQQSDNEAWRFLYSMTEHPIPHILKRDILEALTCSRDSDILDKFLNEVIGTPGFDAFDIAPMVNTKHGKQVVWNFLKHNWANTTFRYTQGGLLLTISTTMTTQSEFNELDALMKANEDLLYADLYRMVTELVEENLDWLAKNGPVFEQWIMENQDMFSCQQSTAFSMICILFCIMAAIGMHHE